MVQQKLFERIVNQVFKESLQLGELDFLEGKKIKVTLLDVQAGWTSGLSNGKLVLHPPATNVDAEISGNVDEFILLASGQEDPDTLFFQRRLNIEGSTDVSLAVKNVMDSVGPLPVPEPLQKLLVKLVELSRRYSVGATHSRPL